MVTTPQTDSEFLRSVAEEMRSLADHDPNIALDLWQIAADLESAADKIRHRAA
jgi:hypothetical protein